MCKDTVAPAPGVIRTALFPTAHHIICSGGLFPNGILMRSRVQQVRFVAHADEASAIKETIESEESLSGGGQILDTVKNPPLHSRLSSTAVLAHASRSWINHDTILLFQSSKTPFTAEWEAKCQQRPRIIPEAVQQERKQPRRKILLKASHRNFSRAVILSEMGDGGRQKTSSACSSCKDWVHIPTPGSLFSLQHVFAGDH